MTSREQILDRAGAVSARSMPTMNDECSMTTDDARTWDPFAAMQRMLRWHPFDSASRAERSPVPAFEVAEHPSGYTIHADVPGLRDRDPALEVEGNRLTVAAEQRHGEGATRTVERSFRLPADADLDRACADLDGDMLYVSIPKAVEAEPENTSLVERVMEALHFE